MAVLRNTQVFLRILGHVPEVMQFSSPSQIRKDYFGKLHVNFLFIILSHQWTSLFVPSPVHAIRVVALAQHACEAKCFTAKQSVIIHSQVKVRLDLS